MMLACLSLQKRYDIPMLRFQPGGDGKKMQEPQNIEKGYKAYLSHIPRKVHSLSYTSCGKMWAYIRDCQLTEN